MRKLLLTTICLMLASVLMAGSVDTDEARAKALAFLNGKAGGKTSVAKAPRAQQELTVASTGEAYHVFNIGTNAGFVVVSGSDYAPDILGYADEGTFDAENLPENLQAWMQGYADQIAYLEQTGGMGMRKVSASWTSIAPLIQTKWDQSSPYNYLCPDFFTFGKASTGCIATALAQVLYYQNQKEGFPTGTTKDIPAYDCSRIWTGYGQIHVDVCPAGKFDWVNMQTSYSWPLSKEDAKCQAVAKLMQYCGAALRMDYANSSNGGSSSSLGNVPQALNDYFGYDRNVQYRNRINYTTAEWENMIYQELKAGHPVLYGGQSTGGGHGFVCDGYSEGGFFHINWGWSGTANSYFLLSVLNPIEQGAGASSTYDGYSMDQDIVIGFRKPTGKTVEDGPLTLTLVGLNYKGDPEQPKSGSILIPYTYNYFCSWSYPYTYTSGLGIFEENGTMIDVQYFPSVNKTSPGNNVSGNGTIHLPTNVLVSGKTYRIKPVIQMSGSSTWQTCLNENDYYIKAVVVGNKVQLSTVNPNTKLAVMGMSPSECLPNKIATINFSIKNNSTSTFIGNLYLFVNGVAGPVAGCNFSAEAGKIETAFFTFRPTGEVPSVKVLTVATEADGTNVIGTGSLALVSTLTGIDEVAAGLDADDDVWYTINGVKLDGKPAAQGAYIYQGKKYYIQ